MKFRIKRIFASEHGYKTIYLVDMESNSWESEITLRLTDDEIAKRFPGLNIDCEFLLTL